MMANLFKTLSLMSLVIGVGSLTQPTLAATFGQREVSQNRFIVLAAPYGNQSHQLLILEQLSNGRACWQERGGTPIAVDPLLTYFDFTGICGRSMDSNGFSLRIAGQDLGLFYSLRIVKVGNDLRLVAVSNGDRSATPIEIGRVNGIPSGFGKIILNPGWRLTRRTYNGQSVEHLYLTRDDVPPDVVLALPSTPAIVASPRPTALPRSTAVASKPVYPTIPPSRSSQPAAIVIPVPPPEGSAKAPSNSSPRQTPSANTPVLPVPNASIPVGQTQTTALPTIVVNQKPTSRPGSPPAPPSNRAAALGYNYRVVVLSATADTQATVKSLAPDAFRINLNGQTAIQAGLFKEWDKAEQLRQQLEARGLQTQVLPIN